MWQGRRFTPAKEFSTIFLEIFLFIFLFALDRSFPRDFLSDNNTLHPKDNLFNVMVLLAFFALGADFLYSFLFS